MAGADRPPINPPLLAAVLNNDEWLQYVWNWRNHDVTVPPAVRRYDSRGQLTLEPSSAGATGTILVPCNGGPVSAGLHGLPATAVEKVNGTPLRARGGPDQP